MTSNPASILQESVITSLLSNLVWGVAIQPDQDVFDIYFERYFSQQLSDNSNGTALSYDGMKNTLQQLRTTVTTRQFLSESFLVVENSSAHTFSFRGIRAGIQVIVNAVAVVKVEDMQVTMESFVLKID